MHVVAALLATALAALLVFVQPFTGRRRYRALLVRISEDPAARLSHYRRGIAGEWTSVGVIVVIGILAGRTATSIGLQSPSDMSFTTVLLVEVALLLTISTIIMRGPKLRAAVRRQARSFLALLPHTREERLTFAVLAVTAGICEEILFRGFGFAYVRFLWPDATDAWLIAITSIVFGMAHLYQGARGVVLTGLAGAAFASFTLTTGSLLPAIAAHAMIDLRILALPDLVAPDIPAAPDREPQTAE